MTENKNNQKNNKKNNKNFKSKKVKSQILKNSDSDSFETENLMDLFTCNQQKLVKKKLKSKMHKNTKKGLTSSNFVKNINTKEIDPNILSDLADAEHVNVSLFKTKKLTDLQTSQQMCDDKYGNIMQNKKKSKLQTNPLLKKQKSSADEEIQKEFEKALLEKNKFLNIENHANKIKINVLKGKNYAEEEEEVVKKKAEVIFDRKIYKNEKISENSEKPKNKEKNKK